MRGNRPNRHKSASLAYRHTLSNADRKGSCRVGIDRLEWRRTNGAGQPWPAVKKLGGGGRMCPPPLFSLWAMQY